MRRPWQASAAWTPQDAADELHGRRAELIGQLRRRREAIGIPIAAQEEIVDDATTAVVMSPRGVANEHHLIGAFWLAVDHRCRRYREGRHFARLGSRVRVELDAALAQAPSGPNPFDSLELRDRLARAADFMADLSPREREVVALMATRGIGAIPAARLLRLPLGEVRSAARSASAKLDRVAVIAAAGRMCEFRSNAIHAEAAGEANEHEARLARAHLSACVPCNRLYRSIRREMRGREFQQAASAAFLPVPITAATHAGIAGRIVLWVEERLGSYPRGASDRAAEALGGAGLAKAAVAGTALVVAGSALGGHLVHDLSAPARHANPHRAHAARRVEVSPAVAASAASGRAAATLAAAHGDVQETRAPTPHRQTVPSRQDGYLALGGSSSHSAYQEEGAGTQRPRASAASVRYSNESSSAEDDNESAPSPETPPPATPSQSGGGTSLGYLGK